MIEVDKNAAADVVKTWPFQEVLFYFLLKSGLVPALLLPILLLLLSYSRSETDDIRINQSIESSEALRHARSNLAWHRQTEVVAEFRESTV